MENGSNGKLGNLLWIEMINIFHNHFTQNILLATEHCILMYRHHFCFHIRLFFIFYISFLLYKIVWSSFTQNLSIPSPISIDNNFFYYFTHCNVVLVCFWISFYYLFFTTKFPFKFLWLLFFTIYGHKHI